MVANKTLLQMKYARVITLFAERAGIPAGQVMGFFYHSTEYQLMREGTFSVWSSYWHGQVSELRFQLKPRQTAKLKHGYDAAHVRRLQGSPVLDSDVPVYRPSCGSAPLRCSFSGLCLPSPWFSADQSTPAQSRFLAKRHC